MYIYTYSDEEEEEEPEEGWGKKKAYWSGDTADLEIGQDIQGDICIYI
jgi:hypothetical protein